MRLSGPEVERVRAIRVIHAALDAGVTLLDTADVYAPSDREVGHNERLVAAALDRWPGSADRILVVSKGGLRRTSGRWRPDGRAKHLRAACDASRQALGTERIPLYLLHAVDPATPLATTARALAGLQRDGLVAKVGVCNVDLTQIRRFTEHVSLDAVQVELSPFVDDPIRNGVIEWCARHGVMLMAHTPLGGIRRAAGLSSDPELVEVADGLGATPAEVALAWLRGLAPVVVPIAGATRPETARSIGNAAHLSLDEPSRRVLVAWRPVTRNLHTPVAERRPPDDADGEVVLIMGIPAAGKSTLATGLAASGHLRLNRDERGGRVRDLLPALEDGLKRGHKRFVLDNTYPTRAERNRVVELAWGHRVPVRCVWVDTPTADAQINAVLRMLRKIGKLPTPEEIRATGRSDPAMLLPSALTRFERQLEPPSAVEGFSTLEVVGFERRWGERFRHPALVFECDGVLRRSRSRARAPLNPDDVDVDPAVAAALKGAAAAGYALLGICWHPEVARGQLAAAEIDAILAETGRTLDAPVEWGVCPHPPGPPVCWCRKPFPGLVLELAYRRGVDPRSSVLVGPGAADRTLAGRLGMGYLTPAELLAGGVPTPPSGL